MRNILFIVSYDGTRFCGWQRQEGQRTVQAELEDVLTVLHKQKTVLYGSGRTDSGVHAAGQAASFFSPVDSIPVENYIPALNCKLPRDVRILSARIVPTEFHARFSSVSRTYRYFIDCSAFPFAHELPFVWSIRRYPDVEKLNRMASFLRGEIDFTAFTAAGDKSASRCRYVENAVFYLEGTKLIFEITANAFLWKMVRSLTGTLLFLDQKNMPFEYFGEILTKKDRSLCGPTAPPEGLFLWHVNFEGKRISQK